MSTLYPDRRFLHVLPMMTLTILLLLMAGCGFSSNSAPVEEASSDRIEVESEERPAEENVSEENPVYDEDETVVEAAPPADAAPLAETKIESAESPGKESLSWKTVPDRDDAYRRDIEAEPAVEEAPAEAPAMEERAMATTATPAPTVFFEPDGAGEAAGSPASDGEMADEAIASAPEADGLESRAEAIEAQQQSEPLRAGEVDDNARWDDYLLYRRNYRGPAVHNRDISERYVIEVQDGQGNPVLDAEVSIYLDGQERREIYSGRTYADGRMLFHPLALDIPAGQANHFLVEVEKDDLQEQFTLSRFEAQAGAGLTERWTVTLDWQRRYERLNLDVLFLIDATGSMADEIDKIRSTIFDVAAEIDALPGQPDVRYGMVAYRDRGDSFVSQPYEFTPDVAEFHRDLGTVYADGGGDYPESLNEGLHHALHSVEWRGEDTVRLIFLVADAPPHLDYAQDYDYAVEMETAAQRGVKIFPIASSGLDDQGEYIFRQLAQTTLGRFIFLTYEGPANGGPPGDETTHHVEDYSVENLDRLLVGLVREELAYQSPQVARTQ